MDPISAALGVGGLGLQLAGMIGGQSSSKRIQEEQRQQIMLQLAQEAERKKQMELMARRQQMEVVRNSQRARALALNNATGQGAQFGSGLQGGYGQIASDTNNNLLGIQQNLAIGRNMFGLNAQMSQSKINQSEAEGDAAFWKGLSSLGGSMIGGMGMANQLFASGGNKKNGQTFSWVSA